MDYGYICYRNNKEMKKIKDRMIEDGIASACIFTDIVPSYHSFRNMIKKLTEDDVVHVNSISQIADTYEDILERLHILKNASIIAFEEGNHALRVNDFLEVYSSIEKKRKEQFKKQQLKGIREALEKKWNGYGAYGRPKVDMPEDFEENILRVMRKEMTHEQYQKKCGLKRGTYYNLLKRLREEWRDRELNKYGEENKEAKDQK